MSASPYDEFLEPMVTAVRAASRICRALQAELRAADSVQKLDKSPVTVADLAGQALVAHRLHERFPDVPLIGEEDADHLRATPDLCANVVGRVRLEWPDAATDQVLDAIDLGSAPGGPRGRYFTLDPIDGTKGFLRGAQYAVALGLVEDAEPAVGVLGCPNLEGADGEPGLILLAVRGRGTIALPLDGEGVDWGAGTVCRVSDREDSAAIRMCESVEAAHSAHGESAAVAERLGIFAAPVRIDSQAKYAVLALGGAELYLRIPTNPRRREKIWDHAAGSIVVTEAGGGVTDLDGRPLDFGLGPTLAENRGILASNGRVHSRVLAALRSL